MSSAYDMSVNFTQDKDGNSDEEICHALKVSIEDAGGGPFIVIKTRRWAVDSVDELANLLTEVVESSKKLGIHWK
jgi:hypothetical protein